MVFGCGRLRGMNSSICDEMGIGLWYTFFRDPAPPPAEEPKPVEPNNKKNRNMKKGSRGASAPETAKGRAAAAAAAAAANSEGAGGAAAGGGESKFGPAGGSVPWTGVSWASRRQEEERAREFERRKLMMQRRNRRRTSSGKKRKSSGKRKKSSGNSKGLQPVEPPADPSELVVGLGQGTGFVYSEKMMEHRGPRNHPERPERLAAIFQAFTAAGLLKHVVEVPPRPAIPAELLTTHTKAHCCHIHETTEWFADDAGDGSLVSGLAGKLGYIQRGDIYYSKETEACALLSCGSAVEVSPKHGAQR